MASGRSATKAPLRTSPVRAPAVKALFVQILAFVLVAALGYGLPALTEMQLPIGLAALLQGGIAALVTRRSSMAPWWIPIQFAFPVALVTLGAFQLPPWIYLAAFLVLLCLYWTTFRTQVPFYPSSEDTWMAVESLLPKGQSLRIVDIGSGFGGLVMYLAAARPDCDIAGIELAPLPWLASAVRGRLRRSKGRFIRGDYEALSLSGYNVVFAYLSPAAMPSLWRKAQAEMAPGALLLSHEFHIPGVDPDFLIHPSPAGPALYGWRMV
ncbi:class I SAM-dependent methyltransferase [Herbaspirillum sp. HC18]|nr:class I SAM-dependent methyltransferase [Herbaspirillum sp. HC18]